MKKLLLLTGAIIALGGITSCSDDNVASIDPVTTQAEENTPVSFSTYLGNAKSTRAGKTGMITTENLKDADAGFGVFAYSTGTSQFEAAATIAEQTSQLKPDFMYNQKVSWKETDSKTHAGEWTYTPVKFWPNPTNDATLTPKPQYVTYLAYAPYVDLTAKGVDTDYGITGFLVTGPGLNNQWSDIAKTQKSDMIVQYNRKAGSDGGSVDLLWGTAGVNTSTGKTTNGEPIAVTDDGSTVDNSALSNGGKSFTGNGGTKNDTKVNADMTKMNTEDKVQFRFKHALGGFGGSPNGPDNNSGSGLLIDYYADEAWHSGNSDKKDNTEKGKIENANTRVMVNYIAVEFMSNDKNGDADSYNILPEKGAFDLLTGQWWIDQTNGMGGTAAPTTADNRAKYIYYFTPYGSDYENDNLGYKKYVDTYGTRVAEKTLVKLSRALWGYDPDDKTDNANKYDELVSGGGWDYRCSTGVQNVARTVYQDAMSPILFIPGTKLTVKVIVNYDIVTADKNLTDANSSEKGYSISHQEIAKQVDFNTPIIMNRVHALYIHLGLTSIKLDAVVEAFSNESQLDTEKTDGTNVTAEIEDAPISPNEVPSTKPKP